MRISDWSSDVCSSDLLKVRPRMAALAFPDASPDRSALRTLGAVLGAALAALGHAGGVERAAHGVVAHARQVLDAAASDKHHRGLLQVVAFATDVRVYFVTVGQAHLGHLAQGRVRLLDRKC